MSDNLSGGGNEVAGKPNDGGNKAPQSTLAEQIQGLQQGRRVTMGGDTRRSSLGMAEATLGDLFGRRASGFGDGPSAGGFPDGRRGSGFGDIDMALGRRGSLDSTAAVLDAAIMDLTRRRLSMAAGGVPSSNAPSLNDQLSSVNPMAGLGGMNLSTMGFGLTNSFGNQQAPPVAAPPTMPSGQGSATSINSRQQQLQDQQRELERRQQELEAQRQQLIAAMEDRRRTMQQMQQKLQHPPGNAQGQRNPLMNGLGGPNQGLFMGLQQQGANFASPPTQPARRDSNGQEWFVCKICHSKAFSNREELFVHESTCAHVQVRKNSLDALRRTSLDLLVSSLDVRPDLARAGHLGTPHGMQQLKQPPTAEGSSSDMGVDPPTKMSTGPFAMMDRPLSLAMPADRDWLTPLHCFVREYCVQIFTATDRDVATPSKGKRKPIQVGQVGIRCPHCHHQEESSKARERGSVYYPTSIASIYNATMNLLQRHLHGCSAVPQDIMHRYETLKADDARSGTSKKYWVESALALGLVDTPNGIRFTGQPSSPPLFTGGQQRPISNVNANDFFSPNNNAFNHDDGPRQKPASAAAKAKKKSQGAAGKSKTEAGASGKEGTNPAFTQELSGVRLVCSDDEPYATGFSYHLLLQMQPCIFTEADRLGKRKGLPPGFPGLACSHCFGGYGSGRFFPSSIKTLSDTSKTLNVLHNHMMRCRKCPQEVRDKLDHLRKTHDEERAKMKFGSQKAFFARIWDRLHYKDPSVNAKRKFQPSLAAQAANAMANTQGLPSQQQGGMNDVLDNLQQMKYAGDLLDANKRRKVQ